MNVSKFQNHCCGCGECFAICPLQAIEMQRDSGGFFYPKVDENKCVQCGKCVNHCMFNLELEEKVPRNVMSSYALKHRDPEVRAASRSGGIFTALSDLVLQSGGVVYGCTLENCREAVHMRATTRKQRDSFRGSKYIQSKIYDLFNSIRRDLESGLWVLFSGTACQVHAVKDFCKGVDAKLLLVDIVCHGVPSPRVWGDYLDSICKQEKKQAVSADFRDKKRFGWADHKETITFSDGTVYSGDLFTKLFYSHLILREDCFSCPYKNLHRCGDISIADCWGVGKFYPEFSDDKGISLVLVNSEKGRSFFSKLENVSAIPVEIDKLLQPPLRENWDKPVQYAAFWSYYPRHSFDKTVKKFIEPKESVVIRLKVKVYGILMKVKRIISR